MDIFSYIYIIIKVMKTFDIKEFEGEIQDVTIKAMITSDYFENTKNNVQTKIAKLSIGDQIDFMEFVPHILNLNRSASVNFNNDTFRQGFAHNIYLDFGLAFTSEEIEYIVKSSI